MRKTVVAGILVLLSVILLISCSQAPSIPEQTSNFDDFSNNMQLDYAYDSEGEANYTVLRIFQTKRDGSKQYPFVRCPDSFEQAAELAAQEDWVVIINAGLGMDKKIDGVAIENGVIKNDSTATYHAGAIPLVIDADGNLGTAAADKTATEILNSGAVSACCGFCPIIVDYLPVDPPVVDNIDHFTKKAQRQIIGQFGNGDYAIISCAGRNTDNSEGWTLAEAQAVCRKLGLKFAYNLDGGTSVSTFLGKHAVYDYMTGTSRKVPSFIVFNGTSSFSIPK